MLRKDIGTHACAHTPVTTLSLQSLKKQGKSVAVDMMYQTGTFKLAFVHEPRMQVLELPYVGNTLSMVILLPAGTATLEQVTFRDANTRAPTHAHTLCHSVFIP